MTLAVNPNALDATYLGTFEGYTTVNAFTIGSSAFSTVGAAKAVNGLPFVTAEMTGYDEDLSPYFLLDFSNDRTIVWS